jgi:SRSO17 transposase
MDTLPDRYDWYWEVYGRSARTRTRDTRHYGKAYLSALLRMKSNRNITEIARMSQLSEQNLQHFISQSPWPAREMITTMQRAVAERPELAGGMLILDESADEKSSAKSVGASRQYNGRIGQVDLCQVGTFLAYAHDGIWTWLDGEIFIPERWFGAEYAERREAVGIPDEWQFRTKIELGWAMIERAMALEVPFTAVAFDSLYGRSQWLQQQCRRVGIEFYADIPASTKVYLHPPVVNADGQVIGQNAVEVRDLASATTTDWQQVDIRPADCGILRANFARIPVWTAQTDGTFCGDTLLMRRDKKRCMYTLTNAEESLPLHTLAFRKSERYFIERSIQDAKSEFGWDELQTTKLLAWEHHLALTLLASWFIAETRLDWRVEYPVDPTLVRDYDGINLAMDRLPELSVANVRALMRAKMVLPQLSREQTLAIILGQLENRTRSRRSRLKKQRRL